MGTYYGKTGMVERLTLHLRFGFLVQSFLGKSPADFGGENRPVSFWVDEVVIGEVLQQSI